jgi:hypothetical protein
MRYLSSMIEEIKIFFQEEEYGSCVTDNPDFMQDNLFYTSECGVSKRLTLPAIFQV